MPEPSVIFVSTGSSSGLGFGGTLLTGIVILVIGHLVLKWLLEPAQEMRQRIAKVQHVILRWDDAIGGSGLTDGDRGRELANALEEAAADLRAGLYLVPFYDKAHILCALPSREEFEEATRLLIGLSNRLGPTAEPWKNRERVQRICGMLGINVPIGEKLDG